MAYTKETGRFRYKVVSLQVISIRTEAVKLHISFSSSVKFAREQEKHFG